MMTFSQRGPKCIFQVSNWPSLVELERKEGLIYVVTAFNHEGKKSSVRVRHVCEDI